MSGPNPPEWEPDGQPEDHDSHVPADEHAEADGVEELGGLDEHSEVEPSDTGATDVYSRAYSAPESEHFTTVRYGPDVYDYDGYHQPDEAERGNARWPWIVGVAAIVAAVALVVSVTLLVMHTETNKLANPGTSTSTTPFQDQITTTKPPPSSPPPPTTTEPPPTATETQTVTVTPTPTSAPPPPAPSPSGPPPAPSSAAAPPPATSTTPAGPRQITYSVTGTKAPGDIISVTYVDAAGHRRTQHNVYIPWSITVTPISTSDVGSVEASSLFRISRLSCSITTSDGTVLSANSTDAPQTSC
jgi:hypothetical protein